MVGQDIFVNMTQMINLISHFIIFQKFIEEPIENFQVSNLIVIMMIIDIPILPHVCFCYHKQSQVKKEIIIFSDSLEDEGCRFFWIRALQHLV